MEISYIIKGIKHSEKKKAEVIRFAITGIVATILQYALYILFLEYCGVRPVVSTIISYGISLVFNFFMSNTFTFHTTPNIKKIFSFSVSHVINLGLQTGLVAIFSRIFNPAFALLPAIAICVPCNFLMVRFALKSRIFQSL